MRKPKPPTSIRVWLKSKPGQEPLLYSHVGLRADVQAGVLVLATPGGSYDRKAVASFAAGQWTRMEVMAEPHDPQTCPGCIADGSAEAQRRNGD